MAGRIKQLIDDLMTQRSGQNSAVAHFLRAHLVIKGIDPEKYDAESEDDPKVIGELQKMMEQFGRKPAN